MAQQRANHTQTAEAVPKGGLLAIRNVSASPASVPAHPVLGLQRTIGNRAVNRLLESGQLQAKLIVSQPHDPYEQEADRVADQVMRMPDPGPAERSAEDDGEYASAVQAKPAGLTITHWVQRQADTEEQEEDEEVVQVRSLLQRQVDEDQEEEEPLQTQTSIQRQPDREGEEDEEEPVQAKARIHRQADDKNKDDERPVLQARSPRVPAVSRDFEAQLRHNQGQGQPLSETTRAYFESRFGLDFSEVRIHADGVAANAAHQLNAQAFTQGRDIYFGAGRYQPESKPGRQLLAHELTHTVQQTGVRPLAPVPRAVAVATGSRVTASLSSVVKSVARFPSVPLAISRVPQTTLSRKAALASMAEIGPELQEAPEELIEWVLARIQADPEDLSGEVSRRLSQLTPELRSAVMGQIQARLSPEQFARFAGAPIEEAVPGGLTASPVATHVETGSERTVGPVHAPRLRPGVMGPQEWKTVTTPESTATPAPKTPVSTGGPDSEAMSEVEEAPPPVTEDRAKPVPEKETVPKPEEVLSGVPGAERPKPPIEGAAQPPAVEGAAVPGKAVAVSITAEEPGAILEQLSNVPPSAVFDAYVQAKTASATALEKQTQVLQANLPEIPAPTGLPPEVEAREKAPVPSAAKTPPLSLKGEKSGREGKPYSTHASEAAAPPRQPPTVLRGSAETGVPEENAELARSARGALASVRFDTTRIGTHAGPLPTVDLSGEADPGQMSTFAAQSDREVMDARTDASKEIYLEHGENHVYPKATDATLKPTKELTTVPLAAVPGAERPSMPQETVAGLDASLGPVLGKRIGEKKDEYAVGKEKFDTDVGAAREKADSDITGLKDEAKGKQLDVQNKTKQEVAGYKRQWQEEIDAVTDEYKEQADKAGREQARKIADEKQKAEDKAGQHLKDAETKAAAEKQKAEEKAQAEKQKAKEKSGGFWGWAKSKASALIDGLKAAVNAIYDGLRAAVKGIFELAKTLVKGVIELARMAIVGLLKGFGELLKGFVKIAFAAFPEIADKINSKIDAAVNKAVQVVNTVAEGLKSAVAAVLDFLANTLDKLLGLVQSLYNAAFTVIGMLIRGELRELLQRLGNLVDAAKMVPDLFEIAGYEELLGGNLDEPLSPAELAMAGKTPPGAAASGVPAGGGETNEFPQKPYTQDNVGVDEVDHNFELSDELVAELVERTGGEGELEIASSGDKERSIESILVEAAGPQAQTSESEAVKHSDDGLTPMQRAEIKWSLMKQGLAKWWEEKKVVIIAGAVAAIVGVIALTIFTGGAILAAIGPLMSVLGPLFIGASIAMLAGHVADYVSKSWEGDVRGGGKSLSKGLAAGAIELISLVTFKAGGAVLKGVKVAAKGAATLAKGAFAGIRRVAIATAKFLISKGKLLFRGIARSGIGRNAKRIKDLGERLLQRMRVRRFRIRLSGLRFILEGFINPWILLASGEIKKIPSPKTAAGKTIRLRKGERLKNAIVISSKEAKRLRYRPKAARIAEYERRLLTGDSTLLASRLGTPSGQQAHHLLSSSQVAQHQAGRFAAKHGWDLNHAKNGFNIPNKPGKLWTTETPPRAIWHHGGHTQDYYNAVNKELNAVLKTYQGMGKPKNFDWIGEMNVASDRVRQQILSGKIRLYVD